MTFNTSKISILGCGWLGFPLAQSLIQYGFSVLGSTTSASKINIFNECGIEPFLVDIENPNQTIFDFLQAKILIITAPPKGIITYENLILQIQKSPIKKVIFISSTSVYDSAEKPITEEFPLKESTLSKAENLFRNNQNFSTTIIRFAGLIGYNRNPNNFFKNGKKIDNPNGVVNMIHLDDCIRIIETIINQNIWNETFNACADSHPTRKDFYTHAFECFGKNLPEFVESSNTEFKLISNQKLKTILNFEFQYPDLLQLNLMPFGNIKE